MQLDYSVCESGLCKFHITMMPCYPPLELMIVKLRSSHCLKMRSIENVIFLSLFAHFCGYFYDMQNMQGDANPTYKTRWQTLSVDNRITQSTMINNYPAMYNFYMYIKVKTVFDTLEQRFRIQTCRRRTSMMVTPYV